MHAWECECPVGLDGWEICLQKVIVKRVTAAIWNLHDSSTYKQISLK